MAPRAIRWLYFPALICFLALSAGAQDLSLSPRIVQPVDENLRTVLTGNTHRLARAEFDRGVAPPDLPMDRMLLVLKRSPEQEGALRRLLDDQQDKASPHYHKWLSPEEFGKQFGPADPDIQTVTRWLQAHGFQIGNVAKGRNLIEFSGVASQVQEAFHTSIHKFVVNGEEHWANASDPSIPSALTPVVAGVHTLHNFLKKPLLHVSEHKILGKLEPQGPGKPPLVTFPGTPPTYALAPADYATIYNLKPLLSGDFVSFGLNAGSARLAIVGRSNIDLGDVDSFYQYLPLESSGGGSAPSPFVVLNGPDPGDLGGGEEAEAVLDTSWSGGLLKGTVVDLTLVVSASTNTTDGVDLSEAYIIDNDFADVMSESFGSCEAAYNGNSTEIQGIETLAQQAAAQGITYLVATGDSGAENCDDPNIETVATGPISVNILASTPYTVAVGGTMFNENGEDSKYWSSTNTQFTEESALSYIPEDVWNESCTAAQCGQNAGIWAGGGGASTLFTKPSWQSGVAGIPKDGARDVPDVALTAASHDPYLICLDGSCTPNSKGEIEFAAVSGTSASTPSFAAIMTLVDQSTQNRQGQANYVLYKLAATEKLSPCNASNTNGLPASGCIFNDVTVGNNAVPGEAGYGSSGAKYQSGVGYDLATGLGSVNIANLIDKWTSVSFKPTTTTITNLSPLGITHGQPVNVSVKVAPNSGGGTPTGNVSLISIPLGTGQLQSLVGMLTLVNGVASGTITSLPGGFEYTIEAQYGGDGTFALSTSAPSAPLQVTPENSITTLSAFTLDQNYNFVPFTGGPYGSFVYLRADVKGQSGNGIPTGSVDFDDTAGLLYNFPFALNSQGNTETPNFLNTPLGGSPTGLFTLFVGANSVTAAYGGDLSFNRSVSSPLNLPVAQAPTTAVLTFAIGAAQGATFTATVNTNSGGSPPTGIVSFFANGAQVGPKTSVSSVRATTNNMTGALVPAHATATYSDPGLPNGSYTISATYSGDQNYLASTSSPMKVTLQPDFTFTEDVSTVNIASPGGSGYVSLTIMASDGYKGTVNFSSSSCSGLPAGAACSFSPASVTGTGTSTLAITTTGASAGILLHHSNHNWAWGMASSGIGLMGLCFFGSSKRRCRRARLLPLALSVVLLAVVNGCGGGSTTTSNSPPPSSSSTPSGTYTVVVTATSGSLSHNVSFKLSVE